MTNEVVIAILAGLGGMLGWGFADFFAKKTIDKIGAVTTLFWGQLIGVLPLFVLFLFNPQIPNFSDYRWAYIVLLGVWSGLSYIPTYVAFGKGKVSLLSPVFASNAVLVAIFSALFFGEIIPFGRQLAFVIVFVGIVLINGDPRELLALISRKKKSSEALVKGLPEILLAVVLYSVWTIALVQLINGVNWVPILLGIRIFSSLTLFIYLKMKGRELMFADKSLWVFIMLIGFLDVAAFAATSLGYSKTAYVSIVAMLGGAFSLPTIILGRIFLKEKTTFIQAVGSFVIIGSIILLTLI